MSKVPRSIHSLVHPNLGAPGFAINHLWIMAGLREDVDRGFTSLRLQPELVRIVQKYAKEAQ